MMSLLDVAHGGYILAAYLLAATTVIGLVLRAVVDDRAQRKALEQLEAQGIGRRSGSPSGGM
jgi:heme exporter protein D